jgi:hypothetical protein
MDNDKTQARPPEYGGATGSAEDVDLRTHFRCGTPRWTVCHCGMQMLLNQTCSVCGYKCTPPNSAICVNPEPNER